MKNEILFLKENIIKVDESVIENMRQKANQSESGKFRYCFHENEDAGMQEMLFVVPKSGYARPHMHKEVAESHVVISGEGTCIVFDDAGNILEHFQVSHKKNFLYRIQKGLWHMVMPLSQQMVIYEVREGKFDKNTNIFPEWAPKENETEKVKHFKQDIIHKLNL